MNNKFKPLLATAALILLFCSCENKAPTDRIRISGSVYVDTVKFAPLIGGRIVELNVFEGKKVNEGETLMKLDCTELELQLKLAGATLKGAEAQLRLIKKGARKEDIANIKELVNQAEISAQSAAKDLERAKALLETSSIPQKQYDDALTRHNITVAQLAQAKEQYAKVLSGARLEEIEAVSAQVEQVKAQIEILNEKMTYCEVKAPASGIILEKLAEPGEVAAPGLAAAVIADLSNVKVKGFVMEQELGYIKLGGKASVFIDSEPQTAIDAAVTFISSEAEFTPKNIQTQNERVKTMYEIEVSVENKDGKLKSGMPADIEIMK